MTTPSPSTKLRRILKEKTRELATLQRVTEVISTGLDLALLLDEIVGMVVDITRADACMVYLLDDAKNELVLSASKNPHPTLVGRIHLEVGEGITGWVAREKQPVAISKRAYDDPRFAFFHKLREDRYQAFLSVPIIAQGEVIGVINAQHQAPHAHTASEISLLLTIGCQVGGAIRNALLYEETKKKALQISTLARVSQTVASNQYLEEILHLIVTVTAGMMNSTICSIMVLDGTELRIAATQSLSDDYRKKANVTVGDSISGRVVLERRPIMVKDVRRDPYYRFTDLAKKEGLCSLLSVPMMVKDHAIGVINVYTEAVHHFTQEEVALLQTVANQAAVAIENTALLKRPLKDETAM